MDVSELIDRHEITELLIGYTRAVDTSGWDRLDDLFTADAVLDYSSTGGPVGALDEAKAFIRNIEGFARWQHLLGQFAIDFHPASHPDRASVVTYFSNPMVAARDDGSEHLLEVGGYYRYDAVRTADGWRIARFVDEIVWTR